MTSVDAIILNGLLQREEFFRKVIPYLKPEYFAEMGDQIVFKHIAHFAEKYGNRPSMKAIEISIANDKSLGELSLIHI